MHPQPLAPALARTCRAAPRHAQHPPLSLSLPGPAPNSLCCEYGRYMREIYKIPCGCWAPAVGGRGRPLLCDEIRTLSAQQQRYIAQLNRGGAAHIAGMSWDSATRTFSARRSRFFSLLIVSLVFISFSTSTSASAAAPSPPSPPSSFAASASCGGAGGGGDCGGRGHDVVVAAVALSGCDGSDCWRLRRGLTALATAASAAPSASSSSPPPPPSCLSLSRSASRSALV
mmetsp:Transcript_69792/g.195087  ORF Transcript_69792/g.195087 Transcript_69792/m.195087 type:complete len:229 (+) Transcript_69792:200-886(+)